MIAQSYQRCEVDVKDLELEDQQQSRYDHRQREAVIGEDTQTVIYQILQQEPYCHVPDYCGSDETRHKRQDLRTAHSVPE